MGRVRLDCFYDSLAQVVAADAVSSAKRNSNNFLSSAYEAAAQAFDAAGFKWGDPEGPRTDNSERAHGA